IDDDGQAYLYFGGGPASTSMPPEERFNNPKNLRGIRLTDDLVNTEGSAFVVDAPVAFEAAHVFKRGDLYYLTYSSHFGGADFGGMRLTDGLVNSEGSSFFGVAPVAFEAAQVCKRGELYCLTYSPLFGGAGCGGNQPRVPGCPGSGQSGYLLSDGPTVWDKDT